MKRFMAHKAYLALMLILSVFISSSLVYASSHKQDTEHKSTGAKTPNVIWAASPLGVFGGGAGMTNQGIYTVVNGDIGTTETSTLVTGLQNNNTEGESVGPACFDYTCELTH